MRAPCIHYFSRYLEIAHIRDFMTSTATSCLKGDFQMKSIPHNFQGTYLVSFQRNTVFIMLQLSPCGPLKLCGRIAQSLES